MNKEKPEVYALRQDGENWQITRRDFLKAAGVGAAALGVGLNNRLAKPAAAEESLDELCKNAPAHEAGRYIQWLLTSADGKYLLSGDDNGMLKCWDFSNYSLLSISDNMVSGNKSITSAFIDGKNCVFSIPATSLSSTHLNMNTVPELERSAKETWYSDKMTSFSAFTVDSQKNVYGILGNHIYGHYKSDNSKKMLAEFEDSWRGLSISLIDRERKLLIASGSGIYTLDLEDKSLKEVLKAEIIQAAMLPGEARMLICGQDSCALISLIDGSTVWEQTYSELGMGNPELQSAAVTPDGTIGILKGTRYRNIIWLVSLADGTLVKKLDTGTENSKTDRLAPVAVAGDGSKFGTAANNSLLFISLPDLRIIACPVDLEAMKDDKKGIKVEGTDPVTGQTVTYTLPCGAALPPGAVCICNCVAGTVPSCPCVGNTCGCVGNTCGCVSNRPHYWHPN